VTHAPAPEPVLTIGRVDCAYLVPRTHPDGAAAAWRVDTALRPRYADACREALEPLLDLADPSVWIIDRLHLETSLRVGGDPADLGRRWGAALARAISAVLRGEVTEGVLRYRNRAAWLAAFAADLVRGEGRRPAYAALAGVLALPYGRAVVTAAESRQVPVAEVVLALAEARTLAPVLSVLSPADAAAVWRACVSESGPGAAAAHVAEAAARTVTALRAEGTVGAEPSLALAAVGALAELPHARPAGLVTAVAAALSRRSPAPPRGRRAAGAVRPYGSAGPAPDGEVPPGGAPAPAPAATPDGVLAASPYAGVLLLLPGLLAAGLHEVTARFPDRAAALRYRVLLRCLGPAAPLAAGDTALLLAAGLNPSRAAPDIALPPAAEVTAALREFLVAAGRIHAEDPVTYAEVPAPAGAVRITRHGDLWVDAVPALRAEATDHDLVAADIAHLGTGTGPDDLAWTVLAQAGIRLFARRLTGFGAAGIPHLAANVYGRGGVVTTEAGGLDVLLEPPPLQVVLHLAGLEDQTVDVPWLDGPLRLRVRT
jgi:hypothetical protein